MNVESWGFYEDGFKVTWSPSRAELVAAHALRADVFCRELAWVGSRSVELEKDDFDAHCTTVVVVEPDGEVVATVRLVPGDRPWMFDEIFRFLLREPDALHRAGGVEASRLAVARKSRAVRLGNGRRLAELLFKATYLLCRQRGDQYVYMVTSDVVGRRFTTAGLPCSALAPGTRMPDGVLAVPLVLDWDALRSEALRAWFEQPAVPVVTPTPLDAERVRRARAAARPLPERWSDDAQRVALA
jgi:N-acyl-L-homoserine lactone synthetase